MLIGEVSRITSLSKDTIRFYEKRNFFQAKRTESEWNNYKDYDEDILGKLMLIKKCKGFGFSLNEIGEILILFDKGNASCEVMATMARKKLSDIETKIEELEQLKKIIHGKFENAAKLCPSHSGENTNCNELTVAKNP